MVAQIRTKRRLNREQKKGFVAAYHEKISSATLGVLLGYSGLRFHEIEELRKQLRGQGGEFKVVKNRLLKLAAKDTSAEGWDAVVEGAPRAVVLAFDDPVPVAKTVAKFAANHEALVMVSGFLAGKVMSVAQLKTLATLPSREALASQFLGLLKSPQRLFVTALSGVARNLVYLFSNYADKKQKAA